MSKIYNDKKWLWDKASGKKHMTASDWKLLNHNGAKGKLFLNLLRLLGRTKNFE